MNNTYGDNGSFGNDTFPGNDTVPDRERWRDRFPPGGRGRPGWDWARMVMPDTSYLVATCYLSFLCIVAVIMCIRSKTRLRIYACLLTYLGLSIAILGLLQAKFMISANWFWAWNFAAEGVAVVILALTIVSVGSGFYPMAGNKNIYWRMSISIIILYGTFSFANFVYYTYTKLVPHAISPEEVQELRANIIDAGIFTESDLRAQRYFARRRGNIPPGDAAITGVDSWRQLTWAERDMYARPLTAFYLGHQLLMLTTCMWVVMYLFIPLVRHHRHGPVGRPIDSDMMAVGVWYLSSLMTLAFAYAVLNIVFCINQEFIFEQQAQAFDLCLRITIGPIFFLPAPAFLIRFYRNHFQKFKGNSSGGRNKGSGGRTWGSGNRHGVNGSFTNSEIPGGFNGSHSISPEGTRVGSRLDTASAPRGSLDQGMDGVPSKLSNPISPTSSYGKLKFFPTRDRGHSVESSRGLNRDFECESSLSHNLSDGGHIESSPSFSHHLDGHRSTPLRNSVVISYDFDEKFPEVVRASSSLSHPLQEDEFRPYPVDTPQQPKPALTPENLKLAAENRGKNGYLAITSLSDSPRRSPTGDSDRTLIRSHDIHDCASSSGDPLTSELITGSTGWEVGGYEAKSSGENKETAVVPTDNVPTSAALPNATYLDLDGLTGLQKQLAEHRSTLLPQAIAYKANFEERNSDEIFDRSHKPPAENVPATDYSHAGRSEMVSRELYPMTTITSELPNSGTNRAYTRNRDTDFDTYTHPASHAVDPIHWSMTSSSSSSKNKTDFSGGYHHQDETPHNHYPQSRDSKHKDRIISTFSKVISHKPGHAKSSSHHSSHHRSQQDQRDRIHDHHGDNHADASTKGQVVATVEELTMDSVRRYQELDEHYTKGADTYNYSDPYDSQRGFNSKSTTSVTRLPSGNSASSRKEARRSTSPSALPSLPTSYPSHRSTSAGGNGVGAPSIASATSRDSLASSKKSAGSKEPMPTSASARPTSPIPSKKSNSRLSSRTTRSKSDSSSFHEAIDVRAQSPPVEKLPASPSHISSPTLPSFGSSSTTDIPIVSSPPPIKTSLLPPPRQSWNRVPKSSKGGNNSGQIPVTAIDTKLANEGLVGSTSYLFDSTGGGPNAGPSSAGPPTSSSSIANLSFSSSSSSPRAGSPDFLSRDLPQSPMSHSTTRDLSRTSRERARSPKLETSYHQRSMDNLSAAYYAEKRADLGQHSPSSQYAYSSYNSIQIPSTTHHGSKLGITVPSSLMSNSPPSPHVKSPSSNAVGHPYLSHSTTMDGGSPGDRESTYSSQPYYSSYDSSRRGMMGGAPSAVDRNGGRSSSLTTERTRNLLDDDPWTQKFVDRAQAQTTRSTGNAQYGSRHEGDPIGSGGDQEQGGRPAVARTASE